MFRLFALSCRTWNAKNVTCKFKNSSLRMSEDMNMESYKKSSPVDRV